ERDLPGIAGEQIPGRHLGAPRRELGSALRLYRAGLVRPRGFFALGAYTAAAASKHLGLSPWLGLALGAAVAAVVGLGTGFPALRLRGHYLALVTLALAELIRLTAQNWLAVTGGPFGIYDFGSFTGLPATGIPRAQAVYLIVAAIVGAGVGVMLYVCRHTRAGRAFRAVREDEVLAERVGMNPAVYKLLAFGRSLGR